MSKSNMGNIAVELKADAISIIDNIDSDFEALEDLMDGDGTTETQRAAGRVVMSLITALRKARRAQAEVDAGSKIGHNLRSKRK